MKYDQTEISITLYTISPHVNSASNTYSLFPYSMYFQRKRQLLGGWFGKNWKSQPSAEKK